MWVIRTLTSLTDTGNLVGVILLIEKPVFKSKQDLPASNPNLSASDLELRC